MDRTNITLAILSGGQSSRMAGEDKGLKLLNGRPMIQHVLEQVHTPGMPEIIIANRNLAHYQALQLPVFSDENPEYGGPLAGMATALDHCETPYLLVVPCDTPALPKDLAARMMQCMEQNPADIIVAHDGYQDHPSVVLLKAELKPSLMTFLRSGERKVKIWYRQHPYTNCFFSEGESAFANVNTPAQLKDMEQYLSRDALPPAEGDNI